MNVRKAVKIKPATVVKNSSLYCEQVSLSTYCTRTFFSSTGQNVVYADASNNKYLLFLCVCVCARAHLCVSGVFRRQLSVRPRNGGSVVAERRWKEVVEETLLPAEGFWHLLCSQGKGQGVCNEKLGGQYGEHNSILFNNNFIVKLEKKVKF